ncbi:prenyl cysteine carboxyl methyltransferas-like protein Ste14 [Plenodomus tracheiphilus IPT5]|uniref:Protein-S-isoprenylcysteine O-methyltransferase n=1 Tax=Plenodomus tracheiphilus IPT5 TaxID=1408161 RepID=A0A6A7ASZ0_9PLEO|nr:prenyl cysteine carboxyl methyltransferas-like protein Ste14 [Plenodomus tracheiphilus IPT5]
MASNGSTTSARVNVSHGVNRAAESSSWTPDMDARLRAEKPDSTPPKSTNSIAEEFFPHGKRSLAGIAMRAFCLGGTLMLGLGLAVLLAYNGSRLWRPCMFLSALSIFHFLEFYTTAAFNTPVANVASYLLINGDQYQQANSMAFLETCITSYLFPQWQARFHSPIVIALGIVMIAVGQFVRSTAMAQAGTNFNHIVQSRKNDGHELVTHGVYAYFRHPSYFGFFWWGIGTQVMLGNAFCFFAYVGILWYFFMRRITHEEKHLFQFFGEEYKVYKEHTRTWIPFIR